MGIAVRDSAAAAKRFADRAQGAVKEYTDGVKTAGSRWKDGAVANKDNYTNGVQAAITRGAYEAGINEAGASKYQDRASTTGAQRFGPGAAAAAPEWQKKTQPYLDTLRGLDLPPKRERGNPANMARAQAVVQALRAKKVN